MGVSLGVRLSAHTAQALATWPVSASILNANYLNRNFGKLKNLQN